MDDAEAAIGHRIRQLREQVGMQAQELAMLVDLNPSVISNIERGKRGVKTHELAAISKALGVSAIAILDEDSLVGRLPIAPRASSGTLLKGDMLLRLTSLAELHEMLEESEIAASFPPRLPIMGKGGWLTAATSMASQVWKMIGDLDSGDQRFPALIDAIETNLKIDVLVEERNTDEVLGASITDSVFPLIFVNQHQTVPRALFTLAHELAHVIAADGQNLVIDDDLRARSDSERFANAFAASLLLPEAELREQLDGGEDPVKLCRVLDRFATSFETLIYRLHNLRLVSANGRNRLKALGLRGLISQIDDDSLRRRLLTRIGSRPVRHPPSILAERATVAYRRGVISARPLAGVLGIDTSEVAAKMESDARDELIAAFHDEHDNVDSDADLYSGDPVG